LLFTLIKNVLIIGNEIASQLVNAISVNQIVNSDCEKLSSIWESTVDSLMSFLNYLLMSLNYSAVFTVVLYVICTHPLICRGYKDIFEFILLNDQFCCYQ
jgi:hypothetical protein